MCLWNLEKTVVKIIKHPNLTKKEFFRKGISNTDYLTNGVIKKMFSDTTGNRTRVS